MSKAQKKTQATTDQLAPVDYDAELERMLNEIKELRDKADALVLQRRALEAEKWQKVREEEGRKVQALRARLEEEEGVTSVSQAKRNECWLLAWEHGHSSGLDEVEAHYRQFVELIKG